jgi:hypothetical protein
MIKLIKAILDETLDKHVYPFLIEELEMGSGDISPEQCLALEEKKEALAKEIHNWLKEEKPNG